MPARNGAYSSGRLQIQERIRLYAEENPGEKYYRLENEDEIKELLLAIAAVIKLALPSMQRTPEKIQMRLCANQCRAAVVKNLAASHFQSLQEGSAGEFEMFGLTILAPGQELPIDPQ